MKGLVERAVTRMHTEQPTLVVYTVSIRTDPATATSAIGFDTKANSDQVIENARRYDKEKRTVTSPASGPTVGYVP